MKLTILLLGSLSLLLAACSGENSKKGSIRKVPVAERDRQEKAEAPKPERFVIGEQKVEESQLIEALNKSIKASGKAAIQLQRVNYTVQIRTKGGNWFAAGTSAEFKVRNEICSKGDLAKGQPRPLNFEMADHQEKNGGFDLFKQAALAVPMWVSATDATPVVYAELPGAAFADNQTLPTYQQEMLSKPSAVSGGEAMLKVLENNPEFGIKAEDVYYHLSMQYTEALPRIEFSIIIDTGKDTFIVVDLSYAPVNETVDQEPRGC